MNDIVVIIAAAVLLICVILLAFLYFVQKRRMDRLERRLNRFMRGKNAASLEQAFAVNFKDLEILKRNMNIVADALNRLSDMYEFSFQKTGIVKYNAFDEMGGNLSFALALLNRENNGFVINSVHSSGGCYTYIKEIIKGESYVLLGNEERAAVRKAVESDNFMG